MADSKTTEYAVMYRRVSTREQGKSGLGLESQKTQIEAYAAAHGIQIVGDYVDVVSGKSTANRSQLWEAIRIAGLKRCKLICAKVDRLSRSVEDGLLIVNQLNAVGADFIAVEAPTLNKFMLVLWLDIAEHERELISTRTKAALQAAKARGVRLGNAKGTNTFGDKRGLGATEAKQAKAQNFAQRVEASIRELQEQGLSLRKIAEQLNADGIKTARGGTWQAVTVKRVLERLESK